MIKNTKVLSICGSPHTKKSRTLMFIDDFLMEITKSGLNFSHRVVSLGKQNVSPCRGCLNCIKGFKCPINDDLEKIKEEILECDLLIMATPVYADQVTAQMKALFDRLFTWCRVFPLLGTYSLSISTAANDRSEAAGNYIQKMLAAYGTMSFGHISAAGGAYSGILPAHKKFPAEYLKTANRIADVINSGKELPVSRLQNKLFKDIRRKMNTDLIKFEYEWWDKCSWHRANNFKQLRTIGYSLDRKQWLLNP